MTDSSAEDLLTYQGKIFINFQNSTYQWVDIKLFSFPETLSDNALLGLLLRHVRYRDSYAGTGDEDTVILHGPYRLEAITMESFIHTEPTTAEALVRAWAEEHAPLPKVSRSEMERELYPRILDSTGCYQLADLGSTALHDWGWVVGFNGFHELVLINRETRELALVVASDD